MIKCKHGGEFATTRGGGTYRERTCKLVSDTGSPGVRATEKSCLACNGEDKPGTYAAWFVAHHLMLRIATGWRMDGCAKCGYTDSMAKALELLTARDADMAETALVLAVVQGLDHQTATSLATEILPKERL